MTFSIYCVNVWSKLDSLVASDHNNETLIFVGSKLTRENYLMRNLFFYVLLLVLIGLDAWLLAHPNLIGRASVFFLEYDYIDTFPKALGTVAAVVGLTVVVAQLVGQTGRFVAPIVLAALLAVSGYWLFASFEQYNSGVYKLTGAGFRAGVVLLPGLVMLVVGQTLFDSLQRKPVRR